MSDILTLIQAKKFLRIDESETEEDDSVQDLIDSAEKYLLNAGCTLNTGDAVAKIAMKMLVNHWYENREPTGQGNLLAFGLQSLIVQLQYGTSTPTTPTTQ